MESLMSNRQGKNPFGMVILPHSNSKDALDAAKTEILKSTGNKPPALVNPFAGGAVPLEA